MTTTTIQTKLDQAKVLYQALLEGNLRPLGFANNELGVSRALSVIDQALDGWDNGRALLENGVPLETINRKIKNAAGRICVLAAQKRYKILLSGQNNGAPLSRYVFDELLTAMDRNLNYVHAGRRELEKGSTVDEINRKIKKVENGICLREAHETFQTLIAGDFATMMVRCTSPARLLHDLNQCLTRASVDYDILNPSKSAKGVKRDLRRVVSKAPCGFRKAEYVQKFLLGRADR
ncbi:MAG: hypothetical protein EYC62_05860 [Alphaproteobacteria bacterium]|nr:MAG: hypothetical protein EYC62_05860 [Alphaproteobacteria bacterium]